MSHFSSIKNPADIITAIDTTIKYPESVSIAASNYLEEINDFINILRGSNSSGDLLAKIRSPSIKSEKRMTFLKIFRRSVCPVLDTEQSKKIKNVSTESLINQYGSFFKSIELLHSQFNNMQEYEKLILANLLSEYDSRGQSGYYLTDRFFNWFRESFSNEMSILGPQGAGKDIELSGLFADFSGRFPCDFVITSNATENLLAVGFARYDSTRGGSQSDDRTSGNSLKVEKLKSYYNETGRLIKIIFLADGPGLSHKDTWEEAQDLDRSWADNARVTTLKIAHLVVTRNWLQPNS